MNSTFCFPKSSRKGLTLIEVTAGLLILSTLMVATVLAVKRHSHQVRRAEHVLKAVDAADHLLEQWLNAPSSFPNSGSGELEDEEGLRWNTTVVSTSSDEVCPFSIARLELRSKAAESDAPLVSVEFVLPVMQSANMPANHEPNQQ